jgi:hypothetical protein
MGKKKMGKFLIFIIVKFFAPTFVLPCEMGEMVKKFGN